MSLEYMEKEAAAVNALKGILAKAKGFANKFGKAGLGKQVATGAGIGAATGAVTANPNEEGGALKGALGGAVTGGVLGGVAGRMAKGIKSPAKPTAPAKPIGPEPDIRTRINQRLQREQAKLNTPGPVIAVPPSGAEAKSIANQALKKQESDYAKDFFKLHGTMPRTASEEIDDLFLEKVAILPLLARLAPAIAKGVQALGKARAVAQPVMAKGFNTFANAGLKKQIATGAGIGALGGATGDANSFGERVQNTLGGAVQGGALGGVAGGALKGMRLRTASEEIEEMYKQAFPTPSTVAKSIKGKLLAPSLVGKVMAGKIAKPSTVGKVKGAKLASDEIDELYKQAKFGILKSMLAGAGLGTAGGALQYDSEKDDGTFENSSFGKMMSGATAGAAGGLGVGIAGKSLKVALTKGLKKPPKVPNAK
jgi:hypothetical protein